MGIVHAATATGLAPAADHVPVTRAQVQVLIQAIHPAHGHHLYPDAGDHLAFWIGGASQGEVVCNLLSFVFIMALYICLSSSVCSLH